LGAYCVGGPAPLGVCAFHRSMMELQDVATNVLSKWNLGGLVARPSPARLIRGRTECRMSRAVESL
ncbi:MAG: hypothetical protein AAB368_06345, partial [bacterium]